MYNGARVHRHIYDTCGCASVGCVYFFSLLFARRPRRIYTADTHGAKHKILPTLRASSPLLSRVSILLYIYYINGDLDNPFCTQQTMTKSSSSRTALLLYAFFFSGIIFALFIRLFELLYYKGFRLISIVRGGQ